MKKEEEKEILEDVEFVEENEEVSGFGGKKSDKKLKEKIKVLEDEKAEYLDGWQRARAEMVNLKKTHEEEKKLFTAMGRESIITEVIPALDNFDAAFSNKEAWAKVDDAWRTGVEYIYDQFIVMLENNGAEQFGKPGDVFDEALHLSVENIPAEGEGYDGTVAAVVQKGYKSADKVLREAKVKTYTS